MAQEIPILRFCEVESVDDSTGCNRIKARLQPEDGNIALDQVPYAIPLLPQIFHVKPKKGEGVLIINAIATNGESQRYFIGPVISQLNHLPFEPIADAKKEFLGTEKKIDKNPTMDTDKTSGAIAQEEDVALYGRKFSDLILSEDSLKIRCGVKNVSTVDERDFSFNGKTSSFIKLKYYPHGKELEDGTRFNSTATIVADKINLIGNKTKYGDYTPYITPNELISDSEMEEMLRDAHELPYGDRLVTFLTIFRKAFLKHTHPFSMLPPCAEDDYKTVQNYRLERLLSDSVRIN